jgi:hypothetical protein
MHGTIFETGVSNLLVSLKCLISLEEIELSIKLVSQTLFLL